MIGHVFCTVEFEALHYYPDADEEVAFLRNRHRHMFKLKCFSPISHSNRDVEFITLKRDVLRKISRTFPQIQWGVYDIGVLSCEMIAQEMLAEFECLSHVEVSEDGENGCVVYRPTKCECGGSCSG